MRRELGGISREMAFNNIICMKSSFSAFYVKENCPSHMKKIKFSCFTPTSVDLWAGNAFDFPYTIECMIHDLSSSCMCGECTWMKMDFYYIHISYEILSILMYIRTLRTYVHVYKFNNSVWFIWRCQSPTCRLIHFKTIYTYDFNICFILSCAVCALLKSENAKAERESFRKHTHEWWLIYSTRTVLVTR